MYLKTSINLDNIINALMVLLISSITVFTTYTWGRYILILCILCIVAISILQNNLKYHIVLSRFFIILGLFILYTFASALWAECSSDTLTKGKTLFEVLVMVFVIYNCYYYKENGVKDILNIIKISSYIIVIYSILFYGMDNLIQMVSAEERLQNSYANVNTIGMLAAIGVLIQVDQIIRDKKIDIVSVLSIPSIFMIAATQSRKALVVFIAGTFMLLILHNMNSKHFLNSVIKVSVALVAGVVIVYVLLSLPMFSGIMERLMKLVVGIGESGNVGSSAAMRFRMIQIGWEQFLKTPFAGIGIGCSHLVSVREMGVDVYLHNNFIELLSGGGIIGFSIYYSMYVFLLVDFWKYRKYKNSSYYICLVMMIMLLAMDYGMVSYSSKSRYIYLMLYFLEAEALRENAKNECVSGEVKYEVRQNN